METHTENGPASTDTGTRQRTTRLFLIFHGRFPSEKAAALFAGKSAEAFAREGMQVELLVPRRLGRTKVDPHTHYALEKNFSVRYLPVIDFFGIPALQPIAFWVSFVSFSFCTFLYVLFAAHQDDVVYSNETLPLILLNSFFKNTVYEVHDFPEKNFSFYRSLFTGVRHLLSTNTWKARMLNERFGIPPEKIFIEPNAVEVGMFAITDSKAEARSKLHIPLDAQVAVYTGHLYSWKGVDTLASAASLLPNVIVYFVGGTTQDVKHFRDLYEHHENIRIVGHRPHTEIPFWQRAADVLVLPNTAKEEISAHYTSPMKLFEYMASGTPIVASDLPSIREIAANRAILVAPDSPQALAHGLRSVFAGTAGIDEPEMARAWVSEHTWQKRAARILDRIRT